MAEALGDAVQRAGADAPPRFDLLSMLAHGEATRNMPFREFMGNAVAADRRRQRHDAQLDDRRPDGAERASRRIPEAARRSGADPEHGVGDHPLRDAGHPYAPHRQGGRRARRQAHQQGRQGGDVVRLRQPRPRGDRGAGPLHHRPAAAAAASVVRLRHPSLRRQPAGRAAAAHPVGGDHAALPGDRGRRARRSGVYSNFIHGIRSLPVRIPA